MALRLSGCGRQTAGDTAGDDEGRLELCKQQVLVDRRIVYLASRAAERVEGDAMRFARRAIGQRAGLGDLDWAGG
jgi:hypothetical protein